MSEIKFRAWDKELKRMFKVESLDFYDWWVQCERPKDSPKQIGNAFYGERNSFKNEETDRHILMQYTGLKDKNGTEIYERDIVSAFKGVMKSVIIYEHCGFEFKWITKHTSNIRNRESEPMFHNTSIIFEVIGNIHENPELLEESK